GTSTVAFNGVLATPTSWSATSISAPVPEGAKTGNVIVTVGAATSNGVTFTLQPSIASLLPASGPAGSEVTIIGWNFGFPQGTGPAPFNGSAAPPPGWNDPSVVVPVPAGATTGSVVVTVGGVATNGATFTLVAAPSLSSVSPTSGTPGTSVTITGQ